MHKFRKLLTNKISNLEIANSCRYLFLRSFFQSGHLNAAISVKVNDLIANASYYFLYAELIRKYLLHLQQQICVFIYQTMNIT